MRTQLYINNTLVPVTEEVSIKITKQIIDIESPEDRKADRTLTVTIPGSSEVDILFGRIFDINLSIRNTSETNFNPDFNPNFKADTRILIDSIPQLTGYCQLNEIVRLNYKQYEYSLVIYGVFADLFATIGALKLTDLDLSEFDHDYTSGNIRDSWDFEITQNGSPTPFLLGNGYVYPMIDYGVNTNYNQWKASQYKPAIYAKTYLDKIFSDAGFTYTSDFFDSEYFKKLIIPCTAGEITLTEQDITDREFKAQSTIDNFYNLDAGNTSTFAWNVADAIKFDNDISDPSNQWDTGFGQFTSAYRVNGKFYGNISFSARVLAAGQPVSSSVYRYFCCFMIINRTTREMVHSWEEPFSMNNNTPGSLSVQTIAYYSTVEKEIYPGHEYFIGAMYVRKETFYGTGIASNNYYTYPSGQFDVKVIAGSDIGLWVLNQNILIGDSLPINNTIPTDVLQKDFVVALIRMFNLYIEPDNDLDNHLVIEPREDYYLNDIVDWTDKLDNGKELTIAPMGLLDVSEYHFRYSEDEDDKNGDYQKRFGFTYGRRLFGVTNDFVKEEKVIETIFAATPLFAPAGQGDKVLSRIVFVDQNNQRVAKAAKPRIIFYGGLIACQPYVYEDGTTQITETTYPYAGHLDNPYTPDNDLNFGIPKVIYYGDAIAAGKDIQATSDNLFNKYWAKYINEITDKDSKVVSAYFYLKPSDIFRLSFRYLYFFDKTYYRLLEVNDYDPVFADVTLCRFLKLKPFTLPPAATASMHGGDGEVINDDFPGDERPGFATQGNNIDGNQQPTEPLKLFGRNNSVPYNSERYIIIGNDNTLADKSRNVALLAASGNTVLAPNETALINTHNMVVTRPGTYINNIMSPSLIRENVTTAEILTLNTSPIELLPVVDSDETIEVISVLCQLTAGAFQYSATAIRLYYGTAGTTIAQFSGAFLASATDAIEKPNIESNIAKGDNLMIDAVGGNPITGNGTIDLYIEYRIVKITL